MARAKINLVEFMEENGCIAEVRVAYEYTRQDGWTSRIWEDSTDEKHIAENLTVERGWKKVEHFGYRCQCGEWIENSETATRAWSGHLRGVQHRIGAEKFRLALEEDVCEIARELTAPLEKRGIKVTHSESFTVGGFVGKRGDVKTNRYISAESLRSFLLDENLTDRQRMLANEALAKHEAIKAGIRPWMQAAWKAVA